MIETKYICDQCGKEFDPVRDSISITRVQPPGLMPNGCLDWRDVEGVFCSIACAMEWLPRHEGEF